MRVGDYDYTVSVDILPRDGGPVYIRAMEVPGGFRCPMCLTTLAGVPKKGLACVCGATIEHVQLWHDHAQEQEDRIWKREREQEAREARRAAEREAPEPISTGDFRMLLFHAETLLRQYGHHDADKAQGKITTDLAGEIDKALKRPDC